MLMRFYSTLPRQVRRMSTKKNVKFSVNMDEETYKLIDNEELKPRKHPGRINSQLAELPKWLFLAVERELESMPKPTVFEDSKNLANFLNGRHPPAEETVVQAKYDEIKAELAARREIQGDARQLSEDTEAEENRKVFRTLKKAIHAWSAVKYNRYAGLLYLVSRSAQEYAVLYRILHEITTRDKDFRPRSLLDFGSGVGTSTWVTSQLWPGAITEHMCIDASTEMNDLAESIISHSQPKINHVYHRQYIPISSRTYDIVLSAYTLLELPNMQTRLDSIAKLWARTGRYLIIVEQGTNAGFKMINEVRDFIIHLQRAKNTTNSQCNTIFSPCPHQLKCPRYKYDNTPCNFEVIYNSLRLRNNAKPGTERYSYIVFRKDEFDDRTKNWPRLVRPTLVRSKHSICRMCSADGKLNEIIFTAFKHGKWMYRCARSSRWGDRLPMETTECTTKETEQVESIKVPDSIQEKTEQEEVIGTADSIQEESEYQELKEENEKKD